MWPNIEVTTNAQMVLTMTVQGRTVQLHLYSTVNQYHSHGHVGVNSLIIKRTTLNRTHSTDQAKLEIFNGSTKCIMQYNKLTDMDLITP